MSKSCFIALHKVDLSTPEKTIIDILVNIDNITYLHTWKGYTEVNTNRGYFYVQESYEDVVELMMVASESR